MAFFKGYHQAMISVNISDLKNRLSHYLDRVRRGESVLVRDRDRVIARIDPAGRTEGAARTDDARLDELEQRGTIRRGAGALGASWLKRRPKVRADVVAALLDEREDGR
jgi:antitoxin (DNA-binding transcriptional repressor) of toxin-antitoxin stability system